MRSSDKVRVGLVAAGLLVTIALAACSGPGDDRQLLTESTMPRDEAVRWTGLDDTSGLTIELVHEEGFQDTSVHVVVRGRAADIDRALASAEFATELKPGIAVQEPSEGFDADALSQVRSAQDSWTNPLGQHIDRNVIRGRLDTGEDVVSFTAFDT